MRKPIINPRDNCIACGNCQLVAPNVFRLSGDNKSEVIEQESYEGETANIDRAIRECPVAIIKWTD